MGMMVENEIVLKRINEIKPYIRNPRKNAKTVELLCKLIPKVGFNVPIVIDQKGIIVKGHARYGAAIRLGMKEVPCIVTHADEEAIKADRIIDNKISEFSEWINEEVLKEIENINSDIDFSDLGFPKVNFSEMKGHEDVEKEEVPKMMPERKAVAQKKYYKCVCPDCGHVMFLEESVIEGGK